MDKQIYCSLVNFKNRTRDVVLHVDVYTRTIKIHISDVTKTMCFVNFLINY